MGESMLVPPWLERLLSTNFFTVCRIHGDSARSECNMYCLDCNSDAFCFYCRSSNHKDHPVIQIRRSSYHDVVRVSEIHKVLDINGVQTYVINSARVLFLNERPQPKTGTKGVSHICEICGRSLLDPFRFCSLGCKLVGIKRNGGNDSFMVDMKNNGILMERSSSSSSIMMMKSTKSRNNEAGHQELCEGTKQHDTYAPPPTPPPPISLSSSSSSSSSSNPSRRRKGIPRRAPFGS